MARKWCQRTITVVLTSKKTSEQLLFAGEGCHLDRSHATGDSSDTTALLSAAGFVPRRGMREAERGHRGQHAGSAPEGPFQSKNGGRLVSV